ncbi:MAG: hypothetical protein WBV82_08940 [Myxococcaceae bacterium]
MKTRFAGTLFGLALLLFCEVAWAQKVVVLEFDGDRKGRVRSQIVREILRDGRLEVAAIADYKRSAAKAGFKGKRAMTEEAFAAVAEDLSAFAALDGDVGKKSFRLRIHVAGEDEPFTRELKLNRGKLSAKDLKRIAKSLVAAWEKAPKKAPEPAQPEPAEDAEDAGDSPAVSDTSAGGTLSPVDPAEATSPAVADGDAFRRQRDLADSHTVVGPPQHVEEEFELDRRRNRGPLVGPKLLTLHLGGTSTWRSYCSRPGVAACADYDALDRSARPAGDTVNFSPDIPYAGFGVALDFFPLRSMDNFTKGLGLSGGFSRGFSLTNVTIEAPDGTKAPSREVVSVDDAWHVLVNYRFYFGLGTSEPLSAYVGVRGGVAARSFVVDPNAAVPLPGSLRRFPTFGLDVSIPLMTKFIRIEAAGTYFLDPGPGPDEVAGFGTEASGQGFGVEAGVAGDIWGPIGYELRFRSMLFKDSFTGAGNKWANGGAAEEAYTGVNWGLTASF